MTRRDCWIGIALVITALLGHAAFPRYEWHHVGGFIFVRIDRWNGRAERVAIPQPPLSVVKAEP